MSTDDTAADQIPQPGDYWRDPDLPDEVCFTVTSPGGEKHLVSHVIDRLGPVPLFARWELTPAEWRPGVGLPERDADVMPSLAETLEAVRWLASDAMDVLRSDWREPPTDAQIEARRTVMGLLAQVKENIAAAKGADDKGR